MIFCRANKSEAKHLKEIFDEYKRVLGQKINLNKSEMVFSPNIIQSVKKEFQDFMPIQITDSITKYLGLPTQVGRSKTHTFNFIMERVRAKLKGWKERNLSFSGRGVLIRAVIQALPTYVMSMFLIPEGICDKIEQAICRFWWGGNEDRRRIHWKNKDFLFKPKFSGGQGFRTMRSFNEALLAKQVWRLIKYPTSFLATCLKAKHFPNTDVLKAKLGNQPSFVWSSIYHTKWIIKKGGRWLIGDGKKIDVWDDNWLPHQNGFKTVSKPTNNIDIRIVKDLMVEGQKKMAAELTYNNNFYRFEAVEVCDQYFFFNIFFQCVK